MTDTSTAESMTCGGDLQYVVVTHGEVALRATLVGIEECTTATFEVFDATTHESLATCPGEMSADGSSATASWTPELDPEAGERGRRIYYVCTAGSVTIRSSELEVYLDWVEVTSLDESDQPLPDCGYTLRVGDHERHGSTGSTGTFREVGVPPGDVKFEWAGGEQALVLVAWVDETGPTRKAKLKRVPRCSFVWPDPEAAGGRRWWMDDGSEVPLHARFHSHRQLVNFDEVTGTPEKGSKIKCKLSFHPKTAGKAGAKIYVKAKWPAADQLSKRTTPARALVGGADKPWATGAKGLELTLASDGGEVTFEVELGRAGGDMVTLSVGSTDKCEDAEVVVTNWRKVFYQKTIGPGITLPDLANAAAWFAEASVTAEADGAQVDVTAGPAATATVAGRRGLTMVPAIWFWNFEGDSPEGDVMIVGHHNWMHFQDVVFLQRQGVRGVNLVVSNRVVHGTAGNGTTPFSQAFRDVEATELNLSVPLPDPSVGRLFDKAVHDGGLSVRSCTWTGPTDTSVAAELRGKSGVVKNDWIVCQTTGTDAFDVFFPDPAGEGISAADALPGQIIAAGGTIKVSGTVFIADAGFAGWSRNKQVAIARDEGGDDTINYIVAHEIGHNMRQAAADNSPTQGWEAARYLPPGFAFTDHPDGYQGHGHTGGHCRFGMDAGKRGELNYNTIAEAEKGTCVMWGQTPDDPSRLIGFCDSCKKFISGYDMRTVQG